MTPKKYGPLGFHPDDRYRNVTEPRIIDSILLAGHAYDIDSPAAAADSRRALDTWVRLGLGFRLAPDGERLFDPIEVNNFMKLSGHDGRNDFWSTRFVSLRRRLFTDMAQPTPADLAPNGPRPFTVDFTRTFQLHSIASGTKLRLRAPMPLASPYLSDLQITPNIQTAREAQVNLSSGRLEVRLVTSGEPDATVGARLTFTAHSQPPSPPAPNPSPDPLYLGEKEGLIVITDRIRHLARSLAGTDAPAAEAVRAFWEYINANLICGFPHYDQLDLAAPCDWVLDSGWYDCQMGSALFVALCRAHGIPARTIGGYLLYQRAPANHYWAEVWFEDRGWLPFDFLSWDLSEGNRDLNWRDRYFGRLDYRIASECLPRDFTGALGVPVPTAWCMLQVPASGGTKIDFLDVNGTTVYTDTISVVASLAP